MEFIHLHTDVRGVRFFKITGQIIKEKYNIANYKHISNVDMFLEKLKNNINEYDVVLIMMHGAKDSFILPYPENKRALGDYYKAIRKEHAKYLKNDCVIAIACSTAEKFGPQAISDGALAFLGYDKLIEPLFKVNTDSHLMINSRIRDFYQTQIKRIYSETIAESVSLFIRECYTVEMLKQIISLKLEKRINELFNLDAKSIKEHYGWNVEDGLWKKEWPKMKLYQMQVIDDINPHFVIHGDKGYISMLGLDNSTKLSEKAKSRIERATFMDKEYERAFHCAVEIIESAV